jgi:replicative DNA helicase
MAKTRSTHEARPARARRGDDAPATIAAAAPSDGSRESCGGGPAGGGEASPTGTPAGAVPAAISGAIPAPLSGRRAAPAPGGQWRSVAELLQKLPPHAIEAEMSLLGSMLIDPQVIGDVVLIIRSGDDFYKPANGAIYTAMVELYDQRSSVDIVQLNQVLVDREILEDVGGLNYLVDLANAVPTATNARHYATLVREKAMVRQLIEAAGDILHEAYTSRDDVRTLLDVAEQRIFHIAEQSFQVDVETLQSLIQQTMAALEANKDKQFIGLPTGFVELDELTGGMQRGEMIVVAARPSMGKTALALNIAEQMAMRGHGVGIFSLEMSKQQLVQRLLCSRSGLDSQRVRRSMLQKQEWQRLMEACDQFVHSPVFIDDTPGLTLLQLRAKARRMAARHQVSAIFIDYLQLLSTGGRVESRQVEVSEISRGIKALARELMIPVVCMSQLNRSPEQREGHRPRMSDLRESGSIEQDADVVMMLHREDYYHTGEDAWADANRERMNVAELIITKQRNGPTGTVLLTWVAQSTRFRDYSPAHLPGGYVEPRMPVIAASAAAGPSSGTRARRGGERAAAAAPASAGGPHASRGRARQPTESFRDGGGPDLGDIDGIPI